MKLRLQERLDALRTIIATPPEAPQCGGCRWFVTRFGYPECHRHAPAPNGRVLQGDVRSRIFPIVSDRDACGDFEGATCPR